MRASGAVCSQSCTRAALGSEAGQASEANDYRYCGQWDYSTDENTVWQTSAWGYRTGLMRLGCRFYDAELGRFIQPDPLLGNPYNPQSLNRYAYCANSPLSRVDPAGLKDWGYMPFEGWWWHVIQNEDTGKWKYYPVNPGPGSPMPIISDVPIPGTKPKVDVTPTWPVIPGVLGIPTSFGGACGISLFGVVSVTRTSGASPERMYSRYRTGVPDRAGTGPPRA